MRHIHRTLFMMILFTYCLDFGMNVTKYNSIKLLNSYAKSKKLMLTLHTCWNKEKLLEFSKIANYGNNYATFVSIHTHIFQKYSFNNLLIIIDLSNCPKAWSILLQMNQTDSFASPAKYFIFTDNIMDIESMIRNFTIYPSSDILIAEKYGSDYKLHGVYRINAISDLIWENYGYWSLEHGLVQFLNKHPPSQRRHDLKRQNLKVMIRITNNDTWNHLEDFRHTSVDGFTKLSFGSSKCLFEYCNANVTYIGTEFFGYKDKTGNYSGIVGALMRGEIDTSGSPMLTTIERVPLITYMTMQSPYYIKFILKKPPLFYVKNIFFSAFDYKVWAAVIVSFVVLTIAACCIYNMEAKQTEINFQNKLSISDVILVSLEVLSQQGTYMDFQRMSSRILLFTFLVAFFFIFIAYSGNIVALLQAQVELKSTKELVNSRLELGAENLNFMQLFLSQDTDAVGKEVYRKIGEHGYYPLDVGMEKVRRGFFAYHAQLAGAYYYMHEKYTNNEMCCLQEVEGYFQYLRGYSVTRKDSPYKEIFKTGLLKVDEYGLKLRHYNLWYLKPTCHMKGFNVGSVGLIECQMAFFLLMYGTFISIFFLLVERIIHYIHTKL